MAVTRIKNNQITDSTVIASAKLVNRSVTGGLLSDPLNYSGDFTILGNLTVNGTTTTVDTTNTLVADPVIVLSRGETGSPSNDAGILIERGTSDNAAWLWDETNDRWMAITTTADGQTGGTITVAAYANIKANDLEITSISIGNIDISGNTISSTDSNGNINLTPNGSGEVVAATLAVTDLTTNRVVYVGSNDSLTDDANLTFNGTTLLVTGTSNVSGQFNVDNIRIDGAVISTISNNDNISLTPNGTGTVVAATLAVTDLTENRIVYVNGADKLIDNANLTFNGTTLGVTGTANVTGQLNVDNLRVDGNTLSSTNGDGNISLTPDGLGNVIISTSTASRIFYSGANKELLTTANLTFDGTNMVLAGNLGVNGGDITTTALTASLFNANATTLNIGGAATVVNIASTTGTTIIKNDLQIDGNDIKSSTGNVAITLNNTDVTIVGNLTIQGVTTTVGSQDLTVEDSIINLHTAPNLSPWTVDDGRDIGIKFHYYKTEDSHAFVGWANDTGYLEYYSDATESVGGTITGTYGTIKANIFFSNVATGTAPFTVNSTTEVANLNVQFANNVTGASQPNITSLGNLTIANIDNIQIDGNTISSSQGNILLDPAANILIDTATANLVFYAGTNKELLTNSNLAFNGTTFTVTGTSNVSGQINIDNIRIDGTVISTTANNDNISITPHGTGELIASTLAVTDLTTNRVVYVGANDALVDSSNLTFDGTTHTVTGTSNVAGQFNIDNIQIDGNTISSTNTNGNINIDANGTGYIIVNSSLDNTDFIVHGNSAVSATYANLFYVKASTGQIGIGTNSPASNVLIDMDAFTTSILLPKGTTGQRPSGDEVEGMFRYNTSNHVYEFWDGDSWESTSSNFTTIVADSFSGDGTTLSFTLSQDATSAGIIVSINGVVQIPSTAYGVSGTTLTFTEAPQVGDFIDVRLLTTTNTVTGIADLNTEIQLSDAAELANVVINGNLILQVSNAAVYPGTNGTINLGKSTTGRWNTVYATNTSIQNADLAECYLGDSPIPPATVVCFGGNEEITMCMTDMDTRVAGVVSTYPAHVMNSMLEGNYVIELALQGRVPCRVYGPIRKGDMMVSAGNGMARAEENPKMGSVIGKALENFGDAEGIIEIVVGRV
jgi:cytoskeletal protein CcmA (bactofilin family)